MVASDRNSRRAIRALDSRQAGQYLQPPWSVQRAHQLPRAVRAEPLFGDAAIRRRRLATSTGAPGWRPPAPARSGPPAESYLHRNPAAPARSARTTYWSASKVVSTTTTGDRRSPLMRPIAVSPSTPGIRRSMSTTSASARPPRHPPPRPGRPPQPRWCRPRSGSSADARRPSARRPPPRCGSRQRRRFRGRHVGGQRGFHAESPVREGQARSVPCTSSTRCRSWAMPRPEPVPARPAASRPGPEPSTGWLGGVLRMASSSCEGP